MRPPILIQIVYLVCEAFAVWYSWQIVSKYQS